MAINMDSILSKANTYMGSKEGSALRRERAKNIILGQVNFKSGAMTHTPEEAAEKFIDVLKDSINTSGLSQGAINAISNIAHSSVTKLADNLYSINVYFVGDMSRPSLDPQSFPGGIDDIVALFNNGVNHKMKQVHGTWHGQEAWSKTVIPGTNFIEQAVNTFMGSYSAEYNVLDIEVTGLD